MFAKEPADSGGIEKKVVGTGAMVFKDAKAGPGSQLRAGNPTYWGGKPHLDGLQFRI
ncbi:MAG: hypothetical protein FJ035_01730 [Chloroflexi bacterium]|nr:hypothetical protein [Chloroflexota bacterium]